MIHKLRYIIFICTLFAACTKEDNKNSIVDYRAEMKNFVTGLSKYAKSINENFIIIPQNGIELVTRNGNDEGPLDSAYLNAIDGNGQEDLFYGYTADDEQTPSADNSYLRAFLDISKKIGKTILVTDYCSTLANIEDSYSKNHSANYVSFAANHRELNNIPDYPYQIYSENNSVVTKLSDVKNFLYLINLENYTSKSSFINSVTSTNYDLIIMDLFFNDGTEFTSAEINLLKNKANGGKRSVISYMSIGEAEDYRYYWQTTWNLAKPSWMDAENPDWKGNYKVKYWEKDWQDIIFGNNNSYLFKIINAGFDGAYLDIIDAFEFYE